MCVRSLDSVCSIQSICVLKGRGYVLKVCVRFKEVCMCIKGVFVY